MATEWSELLNGLAQSRGDETVRVECSRQIPMTPQAVEKLRSPAPTSESTPDQTRECHYPPDLALSARPCFRPDAETGYAGSRPVDNRFVTELIEQPGVQSLLDTGRQSWNLRQHVVLPSQARSFGSSHGCHHPGS